MSSSASNDLPAAPEPSLTPGTMVGEYRIESKLGEGGFGAVYRGVHPVIGKAAAVKVLHRQFSSNAEMVQRFVSEARAVNQIRHRGIIDIFSFGQLPDGRQYYVMELLDGQTLDAYLRERGGKLSPEEAIPILRGVARAIDAAHIAGIAHRDLKPENVFLTFDDEGKPVPKILDFGIAKLLDPGSGSKTRTGTPMGTPHYMSPEQARGVNVDNRTDVYAFGVMAFQMLTGELPFDGESVMDVLVKHMAEPPPKASSRAPELSGAIDEALSHMMAKNAADRPQTLGAAADELAAAAAGSGFAIPAASRSQAQVGGPRAIASTPDARANAHEMANAQTMVGTVTLTGTAEGEAAAVKGKEPPPRSYAMILFAFCLVMGMVAAWTHQQKELEEAALVAATNVPKTPAVGSSAAPKAPAASEATGTAPSALPSASDSSSSAHGVDVPRPPVVVRFTGAPAGASVFRGTEELGPASAPVELPADTEEIVLTVKAPGFAPKSFTVKPSADATPIAVSLVKLAAPGPSAASSARPEYGENPYP
jgi:serine/threonine-protein kinase